MNASSLQIGTVWRLNNGSRGCSSTCASIHANTPAVPPRPSRPSAWKQSLSHQPQTLLALGPGAGRCRPWCTCIHASLSGHSSPGASSAIPLPHAPYSVELLLAVARLGHLERYRQEVAQFYEPGVPADLTRCGLLITNIFSPQLDHRPYYERLEEYIDRAILAALGLFENAEKLRDAALAQADNSRGSGRNTTSSASHASDSQATAVAGHAAATASEVCSPSTMEYAGSIEDFTGLDPTQPDHLLKAIAAVNLVLFKEEALHANAADPYDPLNGSIADVLDRKAGNQYSLAMVYLHVAGGLGLPCAVVGSPDHILIRVGHPSSSTTTTTTPYLSNSVTPACFLVDVANAGLVYAWPGKLEAHGSSSSNSSSSDAAAVLAASNHMDAAAPGDIDEEWQTILQTQQPQQPGEPDHGSGNSNGSTSEGMHSSGSTMDLDNDNSESAESPSGVWQEVDGYSAVDAHSRNSWKALYGPGALAEWGGAVSSRSSSEQHKQLDSVEADSEPGQAAAAAGRLWFGTVDSPFESAVSTPFNEQTEPCSSSTLTDSMETLCSSDLEPPTDPVPGINSGTNNSCGALPVLRLTDENVHAKYGGLSPVRQRVLLQQLLAGMKLSLLMSGREEEALAVIRYLRATDPFSLPDVRDEGLCLANMEQYEGAGQLLREYLAVAPGAPDVDMVKEVLLQVQLAAEVARARARKKQNGY